MLEGFEIYQGKILGGGGHQAHATDIPEHEPASAEMAEQLVSEARVVAEGIIADARAQAEQHVHHELLARLTETIALHRQEILKSQGPLLAMVEDAVRSIIGSVPADTVHKDAFLTAITKFAAEKTIRVRAASDVFPRYKIIVMGARGGILSRTVDVIEDPDLQDGCLMIEADGRLYEADAETQIDAFGRTIKRLADEMAGGR